jgi:hypothetical protein
MTDDAREAAAMNLHMHDQGATYGEMLAEQIIEQFKDTAKTDASRHECRGRSKPRLW